MTPSLESQPPNAKETADFLRSKLKPELQKVEVMVICGSGLSGLANLVEAESKVVIPYEVRNRKGIGWRRI